MRLSGKSSESPKEQVMDFGLEIVSEDLKEVLKEKVLVD